MALDARVFASERPGTYSTRPFNVVYLVLATVEREEGRPVMVSLGEHTFKVDAEKAALEYKGDGVAYVVEARRK